MQHNSLQHNSFHYKPEFQFSCIFSKFSPLYSFADYGHKKLFSHEIKQVLLKFVDDFVFDMKKNTQRLPNQQFQGVGNFKFFSSSPNHAGGRLRNFPQKSLSVFNKKQNVIFAKKLHKGSNPVGIRLPMDVQWTSI